MIPLYLFCRSIDTTDEAQANLVLANELKGSQVSINSATHV